MAAESDIQQTSLVKQLAANDRPTRDAAIQSLQTYLSGSTLRPLSPLDLLKVHKGLFYSMWHCDRPIPQQQLAQSLADLVFSLPSLSSKLAWLEAFWETMGREWTSVDVLRMEKFLRLARRVVASGWMVAEREGWSEDAVEGVVGVLMGKRREGEKSGVAPFECMEVRVPNGMRYHVIDIYVDELERVGLLNYEGEEEKKPVDKELVERLLEPLKVLSKDSPTKTVRIKAKEALADERLPANWKTEEEKLAAAEEKRKKEAEEGWAGFQD